MLPVSPIPIRSNSSGPHQTPASVRGDQNIAVVVVSDLRVVREYLAHQLSRRRQIARTIPAPSIKDGMREHADVVLVEASRLFHDHGDLGLPFQRPIVAFGVREDDQALVYRCFSSGIQGVLPAEAGVEEIYVALIAAARGSVTFPAWMRATAAELRSEAQMSLPLPHLLSPRERQIVGLIGARLRNREIARLLRIELSTVKNHVHNILVKLRLRRRIEIARIAGYLDGAPGDG